MLNFRITFEQPWLLLLLIPALFFGVLPYFRSPKKYRRTRNRITSVILHCTALSLAILVLSGITFQYDLPNKENEVILLVDKSDSNEKSDDLKDAFVAEVLRNTQSNFKIGVVTFGYDQVYAAELNTDANAVYQKYLGASDPDTSGTDFEAAIKYAASLFTKPESARIVILSDGVETDGNVNNVIRSLASTGIKVDTVHFPDEVLDDIQILAVHYPDTTIRHGEAFEVTLDVKSTFEGVAKLSMFDDATQIGESLEVNLARGTQQIVMEAILPIPGLHKLTFEVESTNDQDDVRNNVYNSHLYIEVFDKLLIIESIAGESDSLCEILNGKKITVVNAYDSDNMPKTLDDLRKYDEIIMVNVANADLPDGFDQILYRYVKDIGGGLFTVCGNKDDGNPNDALFEANAFTEVDMGNSLYQELLPVDIIEYTPPAAVIIIIDTSGSMHDPYGGSTKLEAAQQGALSCVEHALTERDWVGIMTFADQSAQSLELIPRANNLIEIERAINGLPQDGGNTRFTNAINDAGNELIALSAVEKRHIILVTDGQPHDSVEDYGAAMKKNADRGITMSIVGIDIAESTAGKMKFALEYYAGMSESHFHNIKSANSIGPAMRDDLNLPEIKAVNYEPFVPTIKDDTSSIVDGIDPANMPQLGGFYGTKLKEDATEILGTKYVPIYAQWKFGKGTVGSFLCDLNGTWSSDFIESETGQELLINMVEALYPTENIQVPSIRLTLKEHNYRSELNIFADADPTDIICVEVISRFNLDIPAQILYPSSGEEFGKVDIEIKTPGVYEIHVMRQDSEGNLLAQHSIYKSFSYSAEYNILTDTTTYAQKLSAISAAGEGVVLTEPREVFENAIKYLHRVIDPRIVLIIIALVVFLLDIAVRKFKFKWPHEIMRDISEKKAQQKAKKG